MPTHTSPDRSADQTLSPSAGSAFDDAAFAAGVDGALRSAYEQHGRLIHSMCRKALSPEQADEVTQDVFVKAWRARATFDPERGPLVAWLVGITKHRIIDALRSEGRHASRRDEIDVLDRHVEDDRPMIDGIADRMVVADAVRLLPERTKMVIELAYVRDQTHQQISEQTGMALGTVKSDIRRGLARIREHLEAANV